VIRIESTKEIVKVDHKDAEQAYSSFEDLFGIGEFIAERGSRTVESNEFDS